MNEFGTELIMICIFCLIALIEFNVERDLANNFIIALICVAVLMNCIVIIINSVKKLLSIIRDRNGK